MIKLLAIDMDGTLLKSHNKITRKTIKAIKAAMDSGIKVVIATGRNPKTMEKIIRKIKLDDGHPLIGLNGGLTFKYVDNKPVIIKKHLFNKNEVEHIFEVAKSFDVKVFAYPLDDNIAVVNTKKGLFIKVMKIHSKRKLKLISEYPETPELYKTIVFGNTSRMIKFREDVKKHGYSTFAFSYFKNAKLNVEVNPANVDKVEALKEVAKSMNIKQHEVMYFGDGENDSNSIEWAGIGCAMGNAKEHIKNVADEIVPDNKYNGVAKRINQLIKEQGIIHNS